jgi:precorrin-6B methylase 2
MLPAAAARAQVQAPQAPVTEDTYKPVVGQAGKDSVWVPTSAAMVEKMLDMAKVTPADFVMDLGSGDGRMIIAAARRGARALGVEFNNDLVELSKRAAERAGVADKASFVQGDMFAADISKASVLSLFLLPSNLEKLAPKFLDLKPGSRIVSNTFWITGWQADATETLQSDCDSWCTAMLFIIPAKVEGTWKTADGEMTLTQTFQMVKGTYTGNDGTKLAAEGRLLGNRLTMTVGEAKYEGTVDGDTMAGSAVGQTEVVTATRVR